MRAASVICAVLLCSCSPKPAPPNPDAPTRPPSLAGRTVMVLPVQGVSAELGELDADIGYFLKEEASLVRWVLTDAVTRAAENAPTLKIDPHQLAVSSFHRARVERIGEPLFTHLYALARMVDARYALLPYRGVYVPGAAGEPGRVELGVALIDAGDGDVLWIGAIAGSRGALGDRSTVASAATALARLLAR